MPGKKTNETKEEESKDGGVFRITAKAAVIGPDGRVLYKHVGPLTLEALKGPVNDVLSKTARR